jgi:hypothetical protein
MYGALTHWEIFAICALAYLACAVVFFVVTNWLYGYLGARTGKFSEILGFFSEVTPSLVFPLAILLVIVGETFDVLIKRVLDPVSVSLKRYAKQIAEAGHRTGGGTVEDPVVTSRRGVKTEEE